MVGNRSVFESDEEASSFFNYLNTRHAAIQFTMETQNENCLSFLDVLIKNEETVTTSVYKKNTFTFSSFTAESYKSGLANNLLLSLFILKCIRGLLFSIYFPAVHCMSCRLVTK